MWRKSARRDFSQRLLPGGHAEVSDTDQCELSGKGGHLQTWSMEGPMSASLIGRSRSSAFRLSASAVSMSLAGSCFSSESAPGPFHHGIRRRGGTIFTAALPSDNGRSKRTCELTSSIVPRGTSFHCSVDLGCPPIALILCALHAAAVSLVQRNSVPSTQMRCMITANRRARATIAFFIPRRRAICMAQALSQDHLFERSMLCAAS